MQIIKIINRKIKEEKYGELYKLSIKAIKEDQDRFDRIDEKAPKYLSVFTILIGGYAFFGKWILENIIPLKSYSQYVIIITFIIILLVLFYSWFTVLRIIRPKDRSRTNFNEEMVNFFESAKLEDIYYKLSQRNREAFENNLKITNKKASLLKQAYYLVNITVILTLIFTIIFGYYMYNNKLDQQKNYYEENFYVKNRK
ncbi:MAG: hypothetical protein ACLQUW_11675 [Desulfobaccales bacterium]